MAKKIALVGAGCTGKSTVFSRLEKSGIGSLKDTEFVKEAAREYFSDNPVPDEERFTFDTQAAIQRVAFSAEHRARGVRPKRMVCDRSVLDAAVYVAAEGDSEGAEKLYNRVRGYIWTYNHLFLCDPAGVPFKNDNERREGEAKRQQLHETFIDFFTSHDIAFKLLGGTVEERLAEVTTILL